MFPRYYRANSVRYPNGACEGMCAHNHFCAITRVDYEEFRHCRESAASALASSAGKPNSSVPLSALLALVLAVYTALQRQQRLLLFGWLHFVWLVVVNMSKVKCMTRVLVNFAYGLFTIQQNCRSQLFMSRSTSTTNYDNHSANKPTNRESKFFMCSLLWQHFTAIYTTCFLAVSWIDSRFLHIFRSPPTLIADVAVVDAVAADRTDHIRTNNIYQWNPKRMLCQSNFKTLGSFNQIDRFLQKG